MLGTTGESANTIEENTHIAYLCDLLERIWGHGLKKREVTKGWCSYFFLYKFQFLSLRVATISWSRLLSRYSP